MAQAARTPPRLVSRLTHTSAAPVRAEGVTFWEYLTLDELPDFRPQREGLRPKTATNYDRAIFQIYKALGHTVPSRRTLTRLRTAGAETPALPWEIEPPNWQEILRWRDSGRKESLREQQKALVWLASYWGQGEAGLPYFLKHTWATKEAVNRAQQRGDMEEYELHLDLPTHMGIILGASPFEDKLDASKMRKSRRLRRIARYKDKLWRHLCFALFYTGARISEVTTLTLEMYKPDKGGIVGWPQPKKDFATRDVILPNEPWLWHSKVDPSFDWYLKHVRPLVAKSAHPKDPFWINSDGEPYSPNAVRCFVREGISRALNGDGRGPHSLRRGCATWRYHCGWDVEEIRLLLDDTAAVIENSYLDWNWLKVVGRTGHRTKGRTPEARIIRSSGKRDPRLCSEEEHMKRDQKPGTAP